LLIFHLVVDSTLYNNFITDEDSSMISSCLAIAITIFLWRERQCGSFHYA